MSLTEISVRIAVVTVLALVALIAIGWRRPAPLYPRRTRSREAPTSIPHETEVGLDTLRSPLGSEHAIHRTTRKVIAVLGLGSIATFIGIVVALVVSFAIASLVTALLNRL